MSGLLRWSAPRLRGLAASGQAAAAGWLTELSATCLEVTWVV